MTEKRNPAKEYLRGVRGIALEIAELERALEESRERADAVPSWTFDPAREYDRFEREIRGYEERRGRILPAHAKQARVVSADPTADRAAAIADIEALISERIAAAARKRREAEALIEPLAANERRIVRLYYFECRCWDDVAAAMCYGYRHVHRMHCELLAKLNGLHPAGFPSEKKNRPARKKS